MKITLKEKSLQVYFLFIQFRKLENASLAVEEYFVVVLLLFQHQ